MKGIRVLVSNVLHDINGVGKKLRPYIFMYTCIWVHCTGIGTFINRSTRLVNVYNCATIVQCTRILFHRVWGKKFNLHVFIIDFMFLRYDFTPHRIRDLMNNKIHHKGTFLIHKLIMIASNPLMNNICTLIDTSHTTCRPTRKIINESHPVKLNPDFNMYFWSMILLKIWNAIPVNNILYSACNSRIRRTMTIALGFFLVENFTCVRKT